RADPGRAEPGSAVHDGPAEFVRRHPRDLPADPEAELIAIGQDKFGPILSRPGVWAFWWPRFARIARWFVAEEAARRGDIVESFGERHGQLVIPSLAGAFTVTAIADRIDRLHSGDLALIDYKTGTLPTKTEIDNAVAVQLPAEGAIARDGGLNGIGGRPAGLDYWRLSGATQ